MWQTKGQLEWHIVLIVGDQGAREVNSVAVCCVWYTRQDWRPCWTIMSRVLSPFPAEQRAGGIKERRRYPCALLRRDDLDRLFRDRQHFVLALRQTTSEDSDFSEIQSLPCRARSLKGIVYCLEVLGERAALAAAAI